jgi:hypothetical protein
LVAQLTKRELRQVAWSQLGVRVSPEATAEEVHSLLRYEKDPEDLPDNAVNNLRDTLISFINENKEKLSLPCNGNCYEHGDGVVTFCYRQFKEDTSA